MKIYIAVKEVFLPAATFGAVGLGIVITQMLVVEDWSIVKCPDKIVHLSHRSHILVVEVTCVPTKYYRSHHSLIFSYVKLHN